MSNDMNPHYRATMIAQARANGNPRLTVRANALEAGWNFNFACPDYEVLRSADGTLELQVDAFSTGRIKAAALINVSEENFPILRQIGAKKEAAAIITGWL